MDDLTAWYLVLSGVCSTPALLIILVCIVLIGRTWLREERKQRMEGIE